MHALRSLRAHSNNLESLPTSVGGLVSLELCDLGSNRYGPPEPVALNFGTAKATWRIVSLRRRIARAFARRALRVVWCLWSTRPRTRLQ